MQRLKAFPTLFRVRHTGQVLGIVSVLSFKNYGVSAPFLLSVAAAVSLCIALFSFDDARDHTGDALVHPDRPIPNGVYTPRQVYAVGIVALVVGGVFAANLLLHQFLLYLTAALFGLAVIFLTLESTVRATLVAAMIFALFPFAAPVEAVNLIFGLIVVLPHIAGSIAKDVVHAEGDARIGLSPPAPWGRAAASALFFVSSGLTLLPALLALVDRRYLLLILPTLTSCLLLGVAVLRGRYDRVYRYGAVGMVGALAAIALTT